MIATFNCERCSVLPQTVRIYRLFGKRLLDVVLSFSGLLVLAPVACLVSLAVWFGLGWPAIYCQHRLGLNGRRFLLHKFRTMRDATDKKGRPLPDEERATPFGLALRKTSLDELPQLFDVLRGEMSLVGPRPLLVSYRDRYTREEWMRHAVRPGITGLPAVSGRNELDWDARFALDLFYVENYCFMLDMKILFKTVAKVFARSGVARAGDVSGIALRPEVDENDFQ